MPQIVRIATKRAARRMALLGLVVLLGSAGPMTGAVSADDVEHGEAVSEFATAEWPVPLGSGTTTFTSPVLYPTGTGRMTIPPPDPNIEPTSPRDALAAECPDIDDDQLLRNGSMGLDLCVRSVQEARTDEAAAAIVAGFGRLGLPYSRGRRNRDNYDDCSSFVGTSYRLAGRALSDSEWEPSSSVMRNASWATVVDEAKPGDILWRRGHVAIALADGYMMHASEPGDVTHVRSTTHFSRVLAVDPLV